MAIIPLLRLAKLNPGTRSPILSRTSIALKHTDDLKIRLIDLFSTFTSRPDLIRSADAADRGSKPNSSQASKS